jgi:hypothetical protein
VGGECGEECHRFFLFWGKFHTIWKKKNVTKLSHFEEENHEVAINYLDNTVSWRLPQTNF